jgi:hypothetical protein
MIYGQKTPPEYNLDAIKSDKIALIYSNNDWLADVNDVDLLRKQLKGNRFEKILLILNDLNNFLSLLQFHYLTII